MNLLQAMRDEKLFARWFRDEATWAAWRAFVAAVFGLPLSAAEAEVYRACTGRQEAPQEPFAEAWLVCGRRAGKSFVLALIAVFLACFRDYRQYLQPGERATILIIATDRRQARTIFRYIRALITEVPMLARMVERETGDEFDLSNRVTIEVGTSSYRAVRGRTLAAALCDELAFWPTDDAAEPDYAILDALRPAMATIPNAMLLCASSPYARKGALYDAHRRHFGRDEAPVLVWQAATRVMNPTVRQSVVDEAMERDPAWASAEYGAQFRKDVEAFITREALLACMDVAVRERPAVPGTRYVAFVDVAGGGADAMTLGIAHREGEIAILDLIREEPVGTNPSAVVARFSETLKAYNIHEVTGDKYAGEWPRERFREHNIHYKIAEKSKTEIYAAFLPIINTQACRLINAPKLEAQLVALERRTTRGTGRDIIDHPQVKGAHDDVANAAAGALVSIATAVQPLRISPELLAKARQPPPRLAARGYGLRMAR